MTTQELNQFSQTKTQLVEYLNCIFGILPRMREIHWKTDNKNIHESIDNVYYDIINSMDTVTEILLSFYGKELITLNDIQPVIYICDNINEVIDILNQNIITLRNYIQSTNIPEFTSIISNCDQTLENINRAKYRSDFD